MIDGQNIHLFNLPASKKNELTMLLPQYGATLSYILNKSVTMIVTTKQEMDNPECYRLKQAKSLNPNIKIVTIEWMKDLLAKSKKKPTTTTTIASSSSSSPSLALDTTVSFVQTEDDNGRFPSSSSSSFSSSLAWSSPVKSAEVVQKQLTKTTPNNEPPVLNLVVPAEGPVTGDFQIALFGLNLVASDRFSVRLFDKNTKRPLVANQIIESRLRFEFHSATSVVCRFPPLDIGQVTAGQYDLMASNDGWRSSNGAIGVSFVFVEPSRPYAHHLTALFPVAPSGKSASNQLAQNANQRLVQQQIAMLSGQLQNIHRAVSNIQQMELGILQQLHDLTSIAYPDPKSNPFQSLFSNPEDFFSPFQQFNPFLEPLTHSAISRSSSQQAGGKLRLQDEPEFERSEDNDFGFDDVSPDVEVLTPVAAGADEEREIKIFISSTFRDMQQERDLIVKQIVPRIKKICSDRDVSLTVVDLRWGITGAQADTANTLLLCLNEVKSSNVFVGICGERYGCSMIQEDATKQMRDLLKRNFEVASPEFPFIRKYFDRSVTEIEMRMVLEKHHEGPSKNVLFYVRDPYYIEEIRDEALKSQLVSEGEDSQLRQTKLKEFVASKVNPSTYRRPTELPEMLEQHLIELIDHKFPNRDDVSVIDREKYRHAARQRVLGKVFLSNDDYFMKLDKFIESDEERPFVVVGDSGIGKSALLANWSRRHRTHHPEDFVLLHFVGSTTFSSLYPFILWRIVVELQSAVGGSVIDSSYDPQKDPKYIVEHFSIMVNNLLNREDNELSFLSNNNISTGKKLNFRKFIIIIDGLNLLEDKNNAYDLAWLPRSFPQPLRVILSTTQTTTVPSASSSSSSGPSGLAASKMVDGVTVVDSKILKTLTNRKSPVMEVQGLSEAQRQSFQMMFLQQNGSKRLSSAQEAKIVHAVQTSNPRFLQTLLQEISVGTVAFEHLDQMIDMYLGAKSTSKLYEQILERFERDYNTDKKSNMVRWFLSFIWASKNGLSIENELNRLLADQSIVEDQWTRLYFALDDLITTCGNLVTFSNKDFRRAIESKYFSDPPGAEFLRGVHSKIAALLLDQSKSLGVTERFLVELPFHLKQSKDFVGLKNWVCNISVFDKLFVFSASTQDRDLFQQTDLTVASAEDAVANNEGVLDLINNWKLLGQELQVKPVDEYKRIIMKGEIPPDIIRADVVFKIALFLNQLQLYAGSEEFFELSKMYYQNTSQTLDVAKVNFALGCLLMQTYQLDRAETSLLQALSIFQKEQSNSIEVAICLERLGNLYMNQNKPITALDTLEKSRIMTEKLIGTQHSLTANIYYSLACVKFMESQSGRSDSIKETEEYLKQALAIKERTMGDWHPDVARILHRLGAVYLEQNEFLDAEECFQQALLIREEKLGPDHSRVLQTLKFMISCFEMQEKHAQAIEAAERCLALSQKIYGPNDKQVCAVLIRLADLYWNVGKKNHAVNVFRDAIKMSTEIYGPNHPQTLDVQRVLNDLTRPPAPPPPPPPAAFHFKAPIIPSAHQLNAAAQALKAPPAYKPGYVPPPPPPPPQSKMKAPAPLIRPMSSAAPQSVAISDAISCNKKLKHVEERQDRADAYENVLRMVGKRERRLNLKCRK